MSSKNLIIVARYNEDIEWARDLDGDIIIYNKGEDWPWEDIPRIDSENYGREGETFVRAILEFYDILNNYENVIFLQGSPNEHCKSFIDLINNNNDKNIKYITDSLTVEKYPSTHYINNFHLSIINLLFNKKDDIFKAMISFSDKTSDNPPEEYENFALFEESMALCTVLGINYFDEEVIYSTGAQYIVSVNNILSKNSNWWNNLHKLFLYYSKERKIESWTYALERIWPLIWKHTTD